MPGGTKDEVEIALSEMLRTGNNISLFSGEEDPEPGDQVQYNVSPAGGHEQASFLPDEHNTDRGPIIRASGGDRVLA